MSVKLMTADAIRDDLETIALTWPDGVPWQQIDRVNALKTELKRRGEPAERPPGSPPLAKSSPLNAMTLEELETELRKLSARNDEASKDRFADVRFEIRRRAKPEAEATPPRPQVAPRQLELPPDDMPEDVVKTMPSRYNPAISEQDVRPERIAEKERVEQRQPVIANRVSKATIKTPTSVCGLTAIPHEDGSATIAYDFNTDVGSMTITRILDADEFDDFITMVVVAGDRARRMAADK